MARKLVIIILSCCVCLLAGAQAGRGVYAFLDLPTSSRMAALGGSNVSVFDHDVNFVFQNPALLSSMKRGNLTGNRYSPIQGTPVPEA